MSDLTYREIDGALLASGLGAAFGFDVQRTDAEPDQDVPVELIDLLVQHLEEADLMCDHSVGICCCDDRATVQELALWVAGKQTCPDCGGDGIGPDYVVNTVTDPDTGDVYDEPMGQMCLTCSGRGVADIEGPPTASQEG